MVLNSKFNIPNAREMFKSLKNVRSEWKFKTPMQKWCYFYGIGKAAYAAIFIPMLNDINHVHWFAYAALVYPIVLPLLSLYTVCYYAYYGELEKGLPSTCMAFICIGHFPMYLTLVIDNRFKLQSLIDFGGRHIYHDSRERNEYNRICSDHMDITMRRFIIKMGAMFISFLIAVVGPVYAFLINGIHTTTIEVRIPFTEPNSNAEFAGNILLQTIIAGHGGIAYIGVECLLSILENTVNIAPRLVENDLKQTIQLYEEKSITELELILRMENIVKQSNDADNYVYSLSKLFYWRNLFTPTCLTYMIGMAIFCQYTMGFVAGYGMAVMSWTQLFYVCELGENIQDNGFAEMLYQIKWEVLPINIQKAIMLLIHRKQNEEGLSLGPFGIGINRESFKLSTNKVYSFVMFLRNFFE